MLCVYVPQYASTQLCGIHPKHKESSYVHEVYLFQEQIVATADAGNVTGHTQGDANISLQRCV